MSRTLRYTHVCQSDFTITGIRYTAVMDDISLCEEEGKYFIWTRRRRGDSASPAQLQCVSDPTNALIALEEYQTFVKNLEASAHLEAESRSAWLSQILNAKQKVVVEVIQS